MLCFCFYRHAFASFVHIYCFCPSPFLFFIVIRLRTVQLWIMGYHSHLIAGSVGLQLSCTYGICDCFINELVRLIITEELTPFFSLLQDFRPSLPHAMHKPHVVQDARLSPNEAAVSDRATTLGESILNKKATPFKGGMDRIDAAELCRVSSACFAFR